MKDLGSSAIVLSALLGACAKDAPAPAVGGGAPETATVASAATAPSSTATATAAPSATTATVAAPSASAATTAAPFPSTVADGPMPVATADAADRCEKDADCIISDEDVCCPAPSGCMLKVRTAAGAKAWREERLRKFCPVAKMMCKPAGSCQHPKGKLACKSHVCTFTGS